MWKVAKTVGSRLIGSDGKKYPVGQNPALPGAITKIGRFLYGTSVGWIFLCWYTGYVNMRTAPGSGPTLLLPGKPIQYSPDRANRKPKFGDSAESSPRSSGSNFTVPASVTDPRRRTLLAVAHTALGYKSGYSETRPMPRNLAATSKTPTDCSGFMTLIYKAAKLPDPNGLGYNGYGYTGTLLKNGRPTNKPLPGDMAFWNGPSHVGMMIGNGLVIEWGAAPGPIIVTKADEDKQHSSFIGYRTYLR